MTSFFCSINPLSPAVTNLLRKSIPPPVNRFVTSIVTSILRPFQCNKAVISTHMGPFWIDEMTFRMMWNISGRFCEIFQVTAIWKFWESYVVLACESADMNHGAVCFEWRAVQRDVWWLGQSWRKFLWVSNVERTSNGAEEEGPGLQENFPSEGSGCREGAMIGVYRFDSQLKEVMEDTGVKANLRDSPPHL